MKTQISRNSHQPDKRYSGVYQQQGRMLTDADWDELAEIVKTRLDDALHDVVDTGAPRERGVRIETSGGQVRIKGSHVYADGVKGIVAPVAGKAGAAFFRFDQQEDFPNPPSPPKENLILYADVWERTVLALEDAHLLDPALHGADTCTRTQTMAQVKWCPDGKDPETPSVNPSMGDAPATLSLHKKRAEKDPCDPCADEVAPDARIGNYLFRIEIHDVKGAPDKPDEITLKWSSENGAEQYAVGAEPDDFKTGAWTWEFYDLACDKHLGVHLMKESVFSPRRGLLVAAADGNYPDPAPKDDDDKAYPLVRRWDGYVVLRRDGGGSLKPVLVDGKVAGQDLNAGLFLSTDSGDNAHGAILPGDGFTVNLQSLTLSMVFKEKTCVAGDYWLAMVREGFHSEGSVVLDSSLPIGIVHHYLRLARIDPDGKLVPWQDGGADHRRLEFPPLNDLHAGDVAFEKPCDTSIYESVPPASINTVAKALALLCDIRARHVGYENDQLPDVENVKEALDELIKRPGGGRCCKVLVGKGGEFSTIQEALEKLAKQTAHFNLCLLPGEHEFPKEEFFAKLTEALGGEYGLHLTGHGPAATTVVIKEPTAVKALYFVMENLLLECPDSRSGLALSCEVNRLDHIRVEATNLAQGIPALSLQATRDNTLSNCHIMAYDMVQATPVQPDLPNVAGFQNLFKRETLSNRSRFSETALESSKQLARSNQAANRRRLAQALAKHRESTENLSEAEKEGYDQLVKTLSGPVPNEALYMKTLARDLENLRLTLARSAARMVQRLAVVIPDARADCLLENNEVVGLCSLYGMPGDQTGDPRQFASLHKALSPGIQTGKITFAHTGRTLQLRNNQLDQLVVSGEMIQQLQQVAGNGGQIRSLFESARLSDNSFSSGLNLLVCVGNSFTATRFDQPSQGDNSDPAGLVIGDNAVYVGTVGKAENVVVEGGTIRDAEIRLYDATRRQPPGAPTQTGTFRLHIV